ncbi:bacteriophage antitermination protein Q [uncultured Enterobacter sp.]|uniref:bacteriophage antitermination protein Q n=1 Tax=uncultured Enterobacter sp. TaxID=238202 RepID=UPI00266DAF3B|nr:bacteriophage antitermination protein Q [uncultured Enterobacter sp.]
MNAQQLEYVRIQLRAALADDSGGTKGQLEAFAEHPPADKNRSPRQQVHVVELDNGRGGVRRVKAENSGLYVMETRSRRRPMPPIRDKAFSSCAWRRAVLTLNKNQQAWIKYCYGFDLCFSYQKLICLYVWKEYRKKLKGVKLQKRVEKKLMQLVWLATQEVASTNNNVDFKEYASKTLINFLSVNRDTWFKTYSKPWAEFKDIVKAYDALALLTVDEKMINEKNNLMKTLKPMF